MAPKPMRSRFGCCGVTGPWYLRLGGPSFLPMERPVIMRGTISFIPSQRCPPMSWRALWSVTMGACIATKSRSFEKGADVFDNVGISITVPIV